MHRVRIWLVVTAMAVLATGCASSGGGSDVSTVQSAGASAAVNTTASPGPGDFGTLKGVCGPGGGSGATEQGVTDSSIDVGTISDPGAAAKPGVNQELFDSSSAFVKWCNAAGGINGRKINLTLRDAKLFEVKQRMQEACQSDFMLVGGGAALDEDGVDTRVGCKLGEMDAFVNSTKAIQAPYMIQTIPNPTGEYGAGAMRRVAAVHPDAVKHYGLLSADLPGVSDSHGRMATAARKLGYGIVYDDLYPPTGATDNNWLPYVQKMRDDGVQVLTFVGGFENLVLLEKTMQRVGWYPSMILEDASFHERRLTLTGGAAIRNTVVFNTFVPFDEAIENPSTEQYLQILAQYATTGKVAMLGMQSWSAWLLFAESVKACGSQVTRACVLEKAGATKSWTGGGLHVPTDPSPNGQAADCVVLLDATSFGFLVNKTLTGANNGIYNCSPNNVVTLKGG